MDLNYLFHRHQVALHRAENAACEQSRCAHQQMAEGYASRIAELRVEAGAQVAA